MLYKIKGMANLLLKIFRNITNDLNQNYEYSFILFNCILNFIKD